MRATRAGLAIVLATVLLNAGTATAYQVPTAPFAAGDSATTVMPGSGLRQTITATGQTELGDPTTVAFRGLGPTTYQPALAKTTPAQDVVVNTGDCASTGGCGDRGTITIAFSQPVRNPVLHLGGIGGSVTRTVSNRTTAQSELHAILKLSTAGLSLTKLGPGNNLAVTSDRITAANDDSGPNCVNTKSPSGLDASATAACGSVRVNGVVTKVTFGVTALFTKHPKLPATNNGSSGDAFSIVASTPEDFGDAPASYGTASSVISDVHLGKDVTEDNAGVANGTTGPVTPDQGDDGVVFKPLRTNQTTYAADLRLTAASKAGRACAWIDVNVNGSFDPGERACAPFAAGQSTVTLRWAELAPKAGAAYARVRVGYNDAQVEKPTGAADSGEVEDHPLPITPPPPPVLTDDTATTAFGTAVVVKVLANDKPGDPGTPLAPATLCLIDGSNCVPMVNVVGQAKYVANADGTIRVEPVPGFFGVAKPVTYRVADGNGTIATAKLTVTVALPDRPVANPDTISTPQNVSVSVKPLANDSAAAGVMLVPGSVVLRDPADATFKKKVVIAGEGEYVVKPDGGVDFVPRPRFTGVGTSIGYRVSDSTKQTAESTLTVTVRPVTPVANGDSVSTAFDTEVVVPVLENDLPGSPDAPLVPTTLKLVDPVGDELVDKVTVARQGTYLVADGKVTFEPVHGFSGVATAVTYQVLDKNGTAARAALTVSVNAPGPPVANPDTITTLQGRSVVVAVLENDKSGQTGAALVPATVRLLAQPAQLAASRPVTSLVIAGQGKYTAKPNGKVLFEPLPTFSGAATPIGYQVADSNGAIGRSTLTARVTKVQPDATDDTATTPYDTTVTVPVLANDDAGDPSVPLVPSSVRLIDPATKEPKATVVVAGQATYTTTPEGKVVVDPLPKFTGPATPIGYRVSDVNGTITTATLTVTVAKPPAPTAEPDTATGKQNQPLHVMPLANDTAGRGSGLDPRSLTLLDPADGAQKKLVKIPGQAVYQVNPDGTVTAYPLPAFTGTATKVTYRIADWFGQAARSTIAVTITPIMPVAVDDAARTAYAKPVTINVLANDKPGDPSAPLVPASLTLLDPVDGLPKVTVSIPNEGVYTATGGAVRFVPSATFRGPGTPIGYQVADRNGTRTTARLTVTVGRPPVAIADSATTLQSVTVTVNVLANDRPGTNATLDRSTVGLIDPAARTTGYVRKVTVANQGTYSVLPTGAVEFDPLPAFHGKALPINYRVADSDGNYAASTLSVTVTPIWPVTIDDSAITPFEHAITVNVLANDKPGDPSAPLVSASLVLKDPTGRYGKTMTRGGEGSYRAADDGTVTFTPAKGFQGVTTPATYRIADANGTTAEGLLLLTVGKGPSAVADTVTTKQNVTVTVDPLANDDPGTGAELDRTTVQLYAGDWDRKAVVPGQGVFTVNTASGKITFDPEPAYRGVVSIPYRVTDSTGNTASAAVTVTVSPVVPIATDDAASTAYETPLSVNVLANDKPGDASAPLVPAGVRVIDPVTGEPQPALVVPGEGTFTVQPNGSIRFAPVDGFAGATVPVGYEVADRNGTIGAATLTVTVRARPIAMPDAARTKQHVAVTIDPLANDKPGPDAKLDPDSLLLVGPDGALVDDVTVAGQGTYVVANGKVTFSPTATFTGTARPVAYEVKDSNRNSARATITVTVVPVRPVVVDDSADTAFGTAVEVDVLGNDKAGDPSAPLRPESVVLRDPVDGKEKKAVTVPKEGAFAVGVGGTITYTPVKGFVGTTRSIAYRVTDANGTSDTALLDVTVSGPLLARAAPDAATGTPGNAVAVNPLLNDSGEIQPSSVCLRTATGTCTKHVTDGAGTWSVAGDGTVTLKPAAAFTGTAKVTYQRTDDTGETVTAPVKFTVGADADDFGTYAPAAFPLTGGIPPIVLTLGVLLAALGATLILMARTRK
ncbi:Ig-like domain-containing protein [Kribbella solani]|uniref:Ig-like domain-containing protein n=1 Tax=Kribbella solani TaxID=236067 RepID=UPI0029A0A9E2|nr:Ig-like domain-containing protein [Kribbella solani]MDX3006518.1 Ig-like domain-containing protein [Kribbella solani]